MTIDSRAESRRYIFYLADNFSMMSLVSLIEPLCKANDVSQSELYQYRFYSAADSVESVNGMKIDTESVLPTDDSFDAVIVCASYNPEQSITSSLIKWLRWVDHQGIAIGSADTSAFILAKAGLLKGYKTSLHWISIDSFRETYPLLQVSSQLFEYNSRRFSCAGATSGMDLMLHPKVQNVIALMEANCEQPLSIFDLAEQVELSTRRLESLFQNEVSLTPSSFYQRCRLLKARNILKQTHLPVMEVSLACGFSSRTQFSAAYRKAFGYPPSVERSRLD